MYVQVHLTMHTCAEKDAEYPALSSLYTVSFEAESLTEAKICSFG